MIPCEETILSRVRVRYDGMGVYDCPEYTMWLCWETWNAMGLLKEKVSE